MNGKSYPRSNLFLGSLQPSSLNEKDMFKTECSEVAEDGLPCSDLVSQYAVITAIKGGAGITFSPASGGEINNESAIPAGGEGGIMKTFRIEQSSEIKNHDV